MQLTGNTLLITGGGSGIGRALAHAFHALGNEVIVAGRRLAALEETVAGKAGMHAVELDVADAGAVAAAAAGLGRSFPQLNVLVNNAGIMRREALGPGAVADAEATIATNLLGPIRLTAALLPHLQRQPRAAILNVTSGLAFVPLANTPTYCATKAALHSWTQSLRYQLRAGAIEVIELIPPYVQTGLMGPRQVRDPHAMPLADYIAETMALLAREPAATEICVERVRALRGAEASGAYEAFYRRFNDTVAATHETLR